MSNEEGRKADRAVSPLRATFADTAFRYLLLRLIVDERLSIVEAQEVVSSLLTSDAERARITAALDGRPVVSALAILDALCSVRVGAEELRRLLALLDTPTPKSTVHDAVVRQADAIVAFSYAAALTAESPELRDPMNAFGITPLTTEQIERVRSHGLHNAGLPEHLFRELAESTRSLLEVARRSATLAALPDASQRLATARRSRMLVDWLLSAAQQLADPDVSSEEAAKWSALVARHWVLFHGGDARGKDEPLGFRQAIAMRLVEAVATAGLWRTRDGLELEAAAEQAWWLFHEDAPDLSDHFKPQDFVEPLRLWPGRHGDPNTPFKPLADLAARIGYKKDSVSLGQLWRDFSQSTNFDRRAAGGPRP